MNLYIYCVDRSTITLRAHSTEVHFFDDQLLIICDTVLERYTYQKLPCPLLELWKVLTSCFLYFSKFLPTFNLFENDQIK